MPKFTIVPVKRDRRWLNLLAYGTPGAGKTRLLASACEEESMVDVLFVDVEAGDETLVEFEDNEQLVVARCTSQAAISDLYKFLAQHCKAREEEKWDDLKKLNEAAGIDPERIFRTVCLDSLTEINVHIMYLIQGIKADTFETTDLDREADLAEFKEWNIASEMTRLTVRAFRNLPIHVLIACGAADGKIKDLEPDLPGKLARAIQGFVDVVGYLEVGKPSADADEVHRLFLTPSTKRDAKSRLVNLKDPYLDNPDMKMIIGKARKKG